MNTTAFTIETKDSEVARSGVDRFSMHRSKEMGTMSKFQVLGRVLCIGFSVLAASDSDRGGRPAPPLVTHPLQRVAAEGGLYDRI